MKGFVGTVVGGAIGLAALYAVGKIAFRAGYDIANAEHKYEQLKEEPPHIEAIDLGNSESKIIMATDKKEEAVEEKKQGKLGMLFGLRKVLSRNGGSVIGNLIKNPENHVIEACVKGREIHVNVKPKIA